MAYALPKTCRVLGKRVGIDDVGLWVKVRPRTVTASLPGVLGPYRFSNGNMLSMCAARGDVVCRAIHCPSNVLALTRQTGDKSPYYKRPDGGAAAPFSQRSLRKGVVPYPSGAVTKNKKLVAQSGSRSLGTVRRNAIPRLRDPLPGCGRSPLCLRVKALSGEPLDWPR